MLPDDFKISRLITRNPGNHNAKVKISAKMDENMPTRNLTADFNNKNHVAKCLLSDVDWVFKTDDKIILVRTGY